MAITRRETSGGDIRWDSRIYRPDGRRLSRTFRTLGEAKAWEREQLRSRDRGEWIDPAAGRLLVNEWARRWAERPGLRRKTRAGYHATLRRHILPHIGHRPVASVTPPELQAIVDGMQADGYSPHTVRGVGRVIRSLFNAAVHADLLGRSPARNLRLPTAPDPATVGRALEADEVWALADAIDIRYRALVLVGAACGLRAGELAGLQVGDLDLLARTLAVQRAVVDVEGHPTIAEPKSAAGRRTQSIPRVLVTELAAHLARWGRTGADRDEWLFPAPEGGVLRYSSLMRFWRRAVEAAGVAHCTPHDLRRTNATLLVASGVDAKTAQARLGHSDPRLTFGVYARATGAADSLAAEAIDRALCEDDADDPTGTDGPEPGPPGT